jgi:hypothetical protein
MPSPESPRAKLARLEAESEVLFKAWRTAFYRTLIGELRTNRVMDNAQEEMEAAVIRAGNAYKALRRPGG